MTTDEKTAFADELRGHVRMINDLLKTVPHDLQIQIKPAHTHPERLYGSETTVSLSVEIHEIKSKRY